MRARRSTCLCCGHLTSRDPGYQGIRSEAPYCPVCDAVWRRETCVVCGEAYLVDVTRHRGGHHCDPLIERRIEAERRRRASLARSHVPSEGKRLLKGFRLWNVD